MTNVIMFPKSKLNCPPSNMEELLDNVETARKEHIEYVIDEAMGFLFNMLYDQGFDLSTDECAKSTAHIMESLRSAMFKSVDFYLSLIHI